MARVFRYPSLLHKDRHRERGEWRWEKTSNELACGSAFYLLSKKLTHVVVAVLDKECEWGKLPGPRVLDHTISDQEFETF